jgi:hypothetical protein
LLALLGAHHILHISRIRVKTVAITYDHRNDDRRINAHMERIKTSTVMNVQSTNTQTIITNYISSFTKYILVTKKKPSTALHINKFSYQLISVIWYKMVVGRNSR